MASILAETATQNQKEGDFRNIAPYDEREMGKDRSAIRAGEPGARVYDLVQDITRWLDRLRGEVNHYIMSIIMDYEDFKSDTKRVRFFSIRAYTAVITSKTMPLTTC